MKISHDRDKCIGCGLCTAIAPELFEMDNEGKAVLKRQPQNEAEEKKARDAADACPTDAISVEE